MHTVDQATKCKTKLNLIKNSNVFVLRCPIKVISDVQKCSNFNSLVMMRLH